LTLKSKGIIIPGTFIFISNLGEEYTVTDYSNIVMLALPLW